MSHRVKSIVTWNEKKESDCIILERIIILKENIHRNKIEKDKGNQVIAILLFI